MLSNRVWRLAGRWLLTTLATAVITRWLRYALEDRPRMRRAHETEEEVGCRRRSTPVSCSGGRWLRSTAGSRCWPASDSRGR